MGTMKKYQNGGKSALGMKSVKAGFDKNPGVTRADIIVAAKKKAKGGVKLKKAQDGVFAPITVKKAKLDSVINKRKASMDSSRAAFSRKLQEAKSKTKPSKKMMGGGKARNGKSLSPSGSNVSKRLSSYPKTIGKAMNGTTTPMQRRARVAAAIGRGAASRRKSRTAAQMPTMKMGGKCRGGCY